MHLLVKFHIPTETGNELIRQGKMKDVMASLVSELKPEAAYFMPDQGYRSGYLVVHAQDSSSIVTICEPFWMALGATVEILPVMTADELQQGLAALDQSVKRLAFLRETVPVHQK